MKGGFPESDGRQDDALFAVTDVCTSHDGSLVAVAIQRQVSRYSFMVDLNC